jgi:hypothetical protein
VIISHRHRFIFVRTRKTASTSLEIELSRHVGADDVVTSLCARDEHLRRQAGGHGPQNHLAPGTQSDQPYPTPPGPGPGVLFYNHMPAAQIRHIVGARVWDDYFTFCFERNPWDKVVSLYFHRHRTEPRPPLSAFVTGGEATVAVNFPLYHDGERLLVDVVARYEDMRAALDTIFRRIGIAPPQRLPHAKTQFRKDTGADLMDEPTADRIAVIFQREIELGGFRRPAWLRPGPV